MSRIGVTFDKRIRERAKQDKKPMVCLAVDATFMPEAESAEWCNWSLKGPMSKARAEKVRALMREFCNPEEDPAGTEASSAPA